MVAEGRARRTVHRGLDKASCRPGGAGGVGWGAKPSRHTPGGIMSRLIRSSTASLAEKIRGTLRSLRDTRCTKACQVDRELMTLRTDLTRHSGWSAAGIQQRVTSGLDRRGFPVAGSARRFDLDPSPDGRARGPGHRRAVASGRRFARAADRWPVRRGGRLSRLTHPRLGSATSPQPLSGAARLEWRTRRTSITTRHV